MGASFTTMFRSKAIRCSIAIFAVLLCYIILLSIEAPDYGFAIIGGLVGAISALIVLVDFIVQKKDMRTPFPLLFWRAFCDLGLAVRFLAIPGFNLLICSSLVCTRGASDEFRCSFPSAMFEFFTISSEFWFLCNGLDLYYSITNPFSSYKSRMFMYHVGVWSGALMFAFLPLISKHKDHIYGFWYVNPNESDSPVCWIRVNRNSLSLPIWILFFIPLLVIYSVCCISLLLAYARLKKGITRTFLPRMKLLITNTANVIVLILYWMVLIFVYSYAFFTRDYAYNHYLSNILLFIFASKGFSSLIVWIFVTDITVNTAAALSNGPAAEGEEGDIDANKALREEVLNFATAGIRSAARAGDKVTKDRREITRLQQQTTAKSASAKGKKQLITPFFFIRFILGQQEEVEAIETMVGNNKRRTVNASFRRPTASDRVNPVLDDDVEMATMRLSQRPTMVAGADYSPNGSNVGVGALGSAAATNASRSPSYTSARPSVLVRGSEAESGTDADKPRPYTSEASVRASEMFEASECTDENTLTNAAISVASEGAFGFTTLKEIVSNNIFSQAYAYCKNALLDATEAVEFTEFEPYYFREIRLSVGITDEVYINYFSTTIKERLTQGGASGAFFFFSKDEKFIAKSCTAVELESLKGSAERYSQYLTTNRDSFISKIFGAYRLKIYGNSLHFFVMNNIFLNPEGLLMNEKYDIKGSWVARNAETPSNGQSVTCTHCEQKFIYYKKTPRKTVLLGGSSKKQHSTSSQKSRTPLELTTGGSDRESPDIGFTVNPLKSATTGHSKEDQDATSFDSAEQQQDTCPYTVNGRHEPNLILKDNDLKYKLRLPLPTTVHLLRQIQMDADFLLSIGVCDYSLLVGVHNTEYDVLQDDGSEDCPQQGARRILVKKNSVADGLRARHNNNGSTATHINGNSDIPHNERSTQVINDSSISSNSSDEMTTTRKLEVFRVVGPDAYFMGIIDYQQKWTLKKKLERFVKVHLKGADPEGLSAISPEIYRDRFLRKIEDILDFDNLDRTTSYPGTPGGNSSGKDRDS